jgi:2-dehydropantoate 2-reductase
VKILVVGAGAVGGYFGARLAQAGRDVTFLVRPQRVEQLQRDGLRIVSPHGDLTIKPKTVTADKVSAPFDVVFLSVKAQALDQAVNDMAAAVGPDTMIYPVLNGMRHMGTLASRFGERAVLGGVCMVATDLDAEGRIVQLAPMQKLVYGEIDGQISDRVRALDAEFTGAGFDTQLSATIQQDMWNKWVFIATLGLVTCLLDGPIGEINSATDGTAIALRAVEECAAVAAACGYSIPAPFLENLRKQVSDKSSPQTSSMYRDLEKGKSVEVETILGDLLSHAGEHKLETAVLQAACVRLRVYQKARLSKKAK